MQGNDSPYISEQVRVCPCHSGHLWAARSCEGSNYCQPEPRLTLGGAAAVCVAAEKVLHPSGARPVPYS